MTELAICAVDSDPDWDVSTARREERLHALVLAESLSVSAANSTKSATKFAIFKKSKFTNRTGFGTLRAQFGTNLPDRNHFIISKSDHATIKTGGVLKTWWP
jgi:hypothetical protein